MLSLKVRPEKITEPQGSDSPTSVLIITKPELQLSRQKLRTLTSINKDSPSLQLPSNQNTLSIVSLKKAENLPLSEVTSLVPNEIPPYEVEKSENPSVNYFFERAFEASQSKEYMKAITLYRKVLACEANHFETCINIGICMMWLKMYNEAISSFDCAIKSKRSFIPYYNKALTFIATQNFAAALQCMDTASVLFPNPPEELQKIRTFAIFKSGKVSSAISNTEKEVIGNAKVEYKSFSPVEEAAYEKTERVLRKMTLDPDTLGKLKNLTEYQDSPHKKLTMIQDFDMRKVRTSGYNLQEMSSLDTSLQVTTRSKPTKTSYNWSKHMQKEFFAPKRRTPMNVSQLEQIENYIKDPTILKKVREKLKNLEDKLVEYIAKKIQKCFVDPEHIHKSQLTDSEIEKIVGFFQDKNFELIDRSLKNLDFFSGLPPEFRQRIYQVSSIEKYEKGSRLFIQGNVASKFFLVAKGKVLSVVDSEKNEVNSTTEYLRYARSLTTDKKFYVRLENLANCSAAEKTYVLTFPTYEYQQIFADLLKIKIEDRVCFLVTLPLFKGLDPITLIPLAWHLTSVKYSEGDVILEKHQIPSGLFIIFKGYCGIHTTGHQRRNSVGSEYANVKKREPKAASFYTGNLKYPIRNKYSEVARTKYSTLEKIEHGLLRYGDYFGGRVLLDNKYQDNKSKFSIIAESKDVEVLVISRVNLQNMQEKLAIHLKNALQKTSDVDCPNDVDADELDKEFKDWQRFKQELVDENQRKVFVENKKIEFPYLR